MPPRRRLPTTTAEYRALEPEKGFQARVIEAAELLGWRVWHFSDSRRQVAPGAFVGDVQAQDFPDLVMAHRKKRRLVFAELKREGENPTEGQAEALDLLNQIGWLVTSDVRACLWRPSDWPTIEWELTR